VLAETVNLMTADRTRQAGARNGTYKIVCTNGKEPANCEFFNVAKDPLEEYPLERPASCDDYTKGVWKTSDARWNYCRLSEVIATESFMSPAFGASTAGLNAIDPAPATLLARLSLKANANEGD
jgi:hypothetical protein